MAETLKDYGKRVQFSVFVAELDEELAGEMRGRVEKVARADDRVHVFAMCEACGRRTVTLGKAEIPLDEDYYIV